jgi:hypothetical protein
VQEDWPAAGEDDDKKKGLLAQVNTVITTLIHTVSNASLLSKMQHYVIKLMPVSNAKVFSMAADQQTQRRKLDFACTA